MLLVVATSPSLACFFSLLLFLCILLVLGASSDSNSYLPYTEAEAERKDFFTFDATRHNKLPSSLIRWSYVHEHKRFAVTSLVVDHQSDSPWYIPSLHDKDSIGWKRMAQRGFSNRPFACNVRMTALGLASTLEGYHQGGSGFLVIESQDGKTVRHGFNETQELHCYYQSNKGYGSNFVDNPKTYGLAIICPVYLDVEIGDYVFRNLIGQGHYCRVLAEKVAKVSVILRPTDFNYSNVLPSDRSKIDDEQKIIGEFVSRPAAERNIIFKKMVRSGEARSHAVCTVQTFRNQQSGPMLYLFAKYYQQMGWSVIIYDRFGNHLEFLKELFHLPGIFYHPYTAFQLAQPLKYNYRMYAGQSFANKFYYTMEKNWVKGYGNEKADTADQDMDKTRSYDMIRLEYNKMSSILYVDADEYFFCPEAASSAADQAKIHKQYHDYYYHLGVEEMRYIRIPYAGLAPSDFNNTALSRATIDLTNSTNLCMKRAYETRNVVDMFSCWSNASSYDDFSKSSDFAGICPFHYNHWSCDGMRGGGRDNGCKMCRCKVAFDFLNDLAYRPMNWKCHLLHFNDNKYRFQLIRAHGKPKQGAVPEVPVYINVTTVVSTPKGPIKVTTLQEKSPYQWDQGDITKVNPIADMYKINTLIEKTEITVIS